jgi:ankyrin repeat protein
MNKVITFLCLSGLTLGSASLAMEPASASSPALAGQDVTHIDQGQELIEAARTGNLELVQELLAQHVPVDAKNYDGKTALIYAANGGYDAICQQLINAKAQVNARSIYGWTALMRAATNGHKQVCQLLIDAKAQIDAKDNNEWTALMHAAGSGHKEVCQLLVDAKAQVDAKSTSDRTALMCAAENDDKDICLLLIDAMLKPIKQNRAAATLLLGMKKFNKAACMSQNDRNIIQLIAHQIYNPATIQQLFAQIDEIEKKDLKNDLRTYAQQQLKLQMEQNINQGTSHE